jgi:dolichol-phosphate mannosyltransferase
MATFRTLVVLATYNEIENLPGLVDAIFSVLPSSNVLVVDDNSPDGTGTWCCRRILDEPRLRCILREGKLGLGSATLLAFRDALAHDYDVIVTLDADWSHDPAHLPELIAATEHADVAIGSRYITGGTIDGWPRHRRLLSRWMNGLSRAALGLPIHDASGAYRAYRVAKLRELQLDDLRASGYAYLEEILWHLAAANATFAEVPITFRERRAGRSKINVGEAIGKLVTLARLRFSATPEKH